MKSLRLTFLPRLCLVVTLSGSALACYATTEPAVVEVYSVPTTIHRYPYVFYDGRPVYLVGGHWYYRVGPRWYVYRRVPEPLVNQRRYIERRYIERAPPVRREYVPQHPRAVPPRELPRAVPAVPPRVAPQSPRPVPREPSRAEPPRRIEPRDRPYVPAHPRAVPPVRRDR
ncbi:MAG: hypothetical protein DIU78_023495 [Pseudomonadota bacterium]